MRRRAQTPDHEPRRPTPPRVMGRLSYANVAATLALFLSLGGASYAALSLPAGSVGTTQLRPGAVTPAKLGFPLGVTGIADDTPLNFPRNECNGGLEIIGTPPPCPAAPRDVPTPGREVHLYLRSPANLLVSAIAAVRDESASQAGARVILCINIEQRCVAESQVTIAGGNSLQIPLQTLLAEPRGARSAGLWLEVEYTSHGTGEVVVSSASLIATALPQAPVAR